jgi:hypothetical protein
MPCNCGTVRRAVSVSNSTRGSLHIGWPAATNSTRLWGRPGSTPLASIPTNGASVYGLLWPRGAHIRQAGLGLYSTFSDLPPPETLLVRTFLPEGASQIDLSDPQWPAHCLDALAHSGAATLTCTLARSDQLADALTFLATNPVESDYLSVFARTQAIRRVGNRLEADVDIAEALQ